MINLGLNRISALLSHLPTKRTWKAVHIAGTNGKGSVAAYLSSLFLRLSSPTDPSKELKIGRFISPHVIDRWDCITINDQPVSESLFLRVEQEVGAFAAKAASTSVKSLPPEGNREDTKVTEFELLTATAFEIFSQQNCQVAIIECGLGGRLDATNVLDADDVACSVITKIGLDHMGLLGNTVEQIAKEKAGIAKQGVPMVVDGTNDASVKEAIEQVTTPKGATVTYSYSHTTEPSTSNTETDQQITQLPPHQQHNLTLALTAFHTSHPRIPTLTFPPPSQTPSVLPRVLRDVRTSYPARLHHLSLHPLIPFSTYPTPILLDGAHNPQSAAVLRTYISAHQPSVLILALSRGKSIAGILDALLPPSPRDIRVIATRFSAPDNMPWIACTDPNQIAADVRARGIDVTEAGNVVDALRRAVEIVGAGETRSDTSAQSFEIVVAGSLYLASDLLRALRDGEAALTRRFADAAADTKT